jgi:TonB family protein
MGRGLVMLDLEDPPPPSARDETDTGPGPISGPVATPRARPGGMAVSAILHVLIIAMVVQVAVVHAPEAPKPAAARAPNANAVFMPPPAQVRKMLGLRPLPAPRPTPPPPGAKDRISLGAPAPMRSPEPLLLHRDDDLTKIAKGRPDASQTAGAPMPEPKPPTPSARSAGALLADEGRLSQVPLTAGRPGPIHASLQRFEKSGIGDPGPLGAVTGTGGQMGPLFFDPQGADFTEWVQRFKNEVYRNWILPPSATLGIGGGEVDFEFVVDRNGRMTDVRMLESCGTGSLDRAARNALVASLLLPLPADFAPQTVTMKVGFVYGMRGPDSARGGR